MPSETVQKILNSASIEDKVGQLLCFGFSGAYAHRDILDAIRKYRVAGFRTTPSARKFERYFGSDHPGAARVIRDPEPNERVYGSGVGGAPRVSPERYAATLNRLRQCAMEEGSGIPLYFATDVEGNVSIDFRGPGIEGFPHPMGLAASGDPGLSYRVAKAIGQQLRAGGFNWIHSPVLDVNTEPANPEISTRSYSAHPETVARYALESLRGFDEAGVIATGKHFPGRGSSVADVHFGVAVIDDDKQRMRDVHLAPYKRLIEAGLPAIMLAHSIYPAIDPDQEIATMSRAIIMDVLRGELGYDGVVMTDSFTMGGLVAKYDVDEAAVLCIQNGVDLILLKDENALRGEVYTALLDAVRTGRISEDRLENAVGHVLAAKERCGLLDGSGGIVPVETTRKILADISLRDTAREAAEKSLVVLRDEEGLLPLKPGTRVFVVEEAFNVIARLNDECSHVGSLYEALADRGVDACMVDFEANGNFEKIWPVIRQRAAEADIIIHTGHFNRGGNHEKRAEYHKRIAELDTPSIFVTNCPYDLVVPEAAKSVLVTFSLFDRSFEAAAAAICGEAKPSGKLDFDPQVSYN
ncbi:MAG: glycoside hydrolase family 3 protein [Lentisphaeria bacterium]|nr:glycoside hydrolase family 3 protein [Lentisphaeria bacterium]